MGSRPQEYSIGEEEEIIDIIYGRKKKNRNI